MTKRKRKGSDMARSSYDDTGALRTLSMEERRAIRAERMRRHRERVRQGIHLLRKRTTAESAQLKRQIMEVLRKDHPQSIRHVYYHMTNPRLPEPVEKTDQDMSKFKLAW